MPVHGLWNCLAATFSVSSSDVLHLFVLYFGTVYILSICKRYNSDHASNFESMSGPYDFVCLDKSHQSEFMYVQEMKQASTSKTMLATYSDLQECDGHSVAPDFVLKVAARAAPLKPLSCRASAKIVR